RRAKLSDQTLRTECAWRRHLSGAASDRLICPGRWNDNGIDGGLDHVEDIPVGQPRWPPDPVDLALQLEDHPSRASHDHLTDALPRAEASLRNPPCPSRPNKNVISGRAILVSSSESLPFPIPIPPMDSAMFVPGVIAPPFALTDAPRQWEDEVVYAVITERFFDGDASNNYMKEHFVEDRDRYEGGYWGGDLKGVIDKL